MDASDFLKSAIYGAIVADTRAETSYAPAILETNDSIRSINDGSVDIDDIESRLVRLRSKSATGGSRSDEGIAFSSTIPLTFADTSDEAVEDVAFLISRNLVSQGPTLEACCVVLMHTIIGLIGGSSLQESLSYSASREDWFAQLENIGNMTIEEIATAKHAATTLSIVMWCVLNTSSFRECVARAVALKEHDDVIPCIAGAIAGVIYGYKNIPEEWLDGDIDTSRIDSSLFNVNEFQWVPYVLKKKAEKMEDKTSDRG